MNVNVTSVMPEKFIDQLICPYKDLILRSKPYPKKIREIAKFELKNSNIPCFLLLKCPTSLIIWALLFFTGRGTSGCAKQYIASSDVTNSACLSWRERAKAITLPNFPKHYYRRLPTFL